MFYVKVTQFRIGYDFWPSRVKFNHYFHWKNCFINEKTEFPFPYTVIITSITKLQNILKTFLHAIGNIH